MRLIGLVLLLALAVAAIAATQWPDIQRYLKMRQM
jgi:hypothetical protein